MNVLNDTNWIEPMKFMYPLLVSIGILVVVLASLIKFSLKKVPVIHLAHSLYFIIPFGLIGASLFGKIGSYKTYEIWTYFEFWAPGMSIFGSFLFGFIAGFVYFLSISKKTKISIFVYSDMIIPNIFLGQAIGRWGNLFNHEILGNPTNGQLKWLPYFISSRLFYIVDPTTGNPISQSDIVYREPLFLYESFACIIAWIILTFFISNLGRFFSKKPWNEDPNNFPCVFNKKYKWLNSNDVPFYNTQFPIKYKYSKDNKMSLSFWNVWNKAYYFYEPDRDLINKACIYNEDLEKKYYSNKNKIKELKVKIKYENKIIKKKYAKSNLNSENIKNIRFEKIKSIKDEINILRKKFNLISYLFLHDSSELQNLHNPNKYFIIKSGFITGFYIIFYSLIRIILENHRNIYEMTIKWSEPANYVMLTLVFLIGLFIVLLCQFFLPYKIRERGWFYEKSY